MLQQTSNRLGVIGAQIGIVLMTAAAVTGVVDPSGHDRAKIILPNQPAFVFAENSEDTNPIRREKENESPHQFISYGVSQRTPGRTGKQ